jgi:hypothetical protein
VRSKAGLFHARINNEFRDPLGGEADFATDVLAAFAQVTYRIKGDWFLGLQGLVSDVRYRPDTPQDADYLDRVGAEDTTSGGSDRWFRTIRGTTFTIPPREPWLR